MLRSPRNILILVDKSTSFLREEKEWRNPANPKILNAAPAGLTASRYIDNSHDTRERCAENGLGHYILSMGFRPTSLISFVGDRKTFDGTTEAGAIHLSQPGTVTRGIFRAPTEAIHVYLPTKLLVDFLDEMESSRTPKSLILREVNFEYDRVLEYMLRALSLGQSACQTLDHVYLESLCLSILARMSTKYGGLSDTFDRKVGGGLASWRLRRVIDYVAANLDGPIALTDLAEIAGLSRMHFAAQFRRSTGFRPHEYVLNRRIEYAQSLLASSDLGLIEIALSAGFASHAHFSRVFKRFSAVAPASWRALHKK